MLEERDVLTRVRRVRLQELRLWVQEGWVRPARSESGPRFDELDVARVRLVRDLRRDLSVPADTVPVILSLLDQVHGLRRELRSLAEAVQAQPEETRQAIVATYCKDLSEPE
ncbi:MerR family transcriptional regulator [Rhodobacteraceae bacterium KMM 6894]|nr:MerR family transcriptional regulator [Rhodobacteraceae bacterium KMM 6894]